MANENEDLEIQRRHHHCIQSGRFSIFKVNNRVGTIQTKANNFNTNNDSHVYESDLIKSDNNETMSNILSTNDADPYCFSDIDIKQQQINNEDSPYSMISIDYSTQQHNGSYGAITPFTDINPTPHAYDKSFELELEFPDTNLYDSPFDDTLKHIAHIHQRPSLTNTFTLNPQSMATTMPRTNILSILLSNSCAGFAKQPTISLESQCLNENGYAKTNNICDTMNGQVFDATKHGSKLVIKKRHKSLVSKESALKEAIILRHLSVDNKPTNDHMAKYVHFFESEDAYYLVMKKAGSINLADYNKKAHALIAEKKLKVKHWRKILKCIFWQLSVMIHWLHNDMKCCHLNLSLSNVVLLNCDFIQHKQTGKYIADPNLQVRLVDFGAAEIFETKHKKTSFKCMKQVFKKRNYLSAPNVYANRMYDAAKADIWCMGMMLYELATGLEPYKSQDIGQDVGFGMVLQNNLRGLLRRQNKTKNVNKLMLALMRKMLNIGEKDRINIRDILEDEWLCLYWNRYKSQIDKKSLFQTIRNKTLSKKMQHFPYYNL